MLRIIPLLLAASLTLPATASAADWVQAPGSRLAFAGKYQSDVFVGQFPGFATRMHFNPDDLAATRLDVNIPMATATTGNAEFDPEMRGTGFFNATAFPQARYQGSGARKLADGQYAIDGMLTLHGISQPVTLTFSWAPGAAPVLFGRATVKRLDFKVGEGQWSDVRMIPNPIAVSTRVVFKPATP
ncbi:MAG: YceI family protein [Pseudomonadota bacterium]|nr:YceI family protein [Pseudomonadota bacterium]